MIRVHKTKAKILSGTDYREVSRKARAIYDEICSKTKRKPYIRSAYFRKEKIFLDYFWAHLHQKNWQDKLRRLKFYQCALDLIINSKEPPIEVRNPNNKSEILYRFKGVVNSEIFVVQIKEMGGRKKGKHFISVFPE